MKKTARIIHYILLTGALLSFILSEAHAVLAQTNELPITMANARNEVLVDPGESTRIQLRIYNGSDSPIAGNLKIVDFIVDNNEGTPLFIEEPIPNSNRFSASLWMSTPVNRIVIDAKSKTTIDVNINVPFDARPGGRYAALLFEVNGSELQPQEITTTESATQITPRVASLFSIRVIGDVNETALITDFSTPTLVESGPIPVSFEIANRGDIHIAPKGLVTVSDWFGRNLYQEKIPEFNIFPEVSRQYEEKIGEQFMIGRYKIKIAATYGEGGKILEAISYTWVVPWKLITVIALTLAIIFVLINSFRKKTIIHEHDLEKKLKDEEEELQRLKEQLRNH